MVERMPPVTEPEPIPRRRMMEIAEVLGLNPLRTVEIVITGDRVAATVTLGRNEAGEYECGTKVWRIDG